MAQDARFSYMAPRNFRASLKNKDRISTSHASRSQPILSHRSSRLLAHTTSNSQYSPLLSRPLDFPIPSFAPTLLPPLSGSKTLHVQLSTPWPRPVQFPTRLSISSHSPHYPSHPQPPTSKCAAYSPIAAREARRNSASK